MKSILALSALIAAAHAGNQLCGQYDNVSKDGYIINNNLWGEDSGTGSQCTTVKHVSGKGVAWDTEWQWSGGSTSVKSYANSGLSISKKQLVSDIHHMPTSVKWSYSSHDITADISYDLFTAADPNHDPSSGDYELMIWLATYGTMQPIGTKADTAQIGGHTWDVWAGQGSGTSMTTYSFVSHGNLNHWSGDVKNFFDYLTKHQNFPASQQHLLTLQFGTEPVDGGKTTFSVSDWMAGVH